jgi:hypothetical protein
MYARPRHRESSARDDGDAAGSDVLTLELVVLMLGVAVAVLAWALGRFATRAADGGWVAGFVAAGIVVAATVWCARRCRRRGGSP